MEKKEEIQLTQQRDNYADFLKYFLIWMVVLGHFINFYQRTAGPISGLYQCIYTFHMPLFVFISGYFSKHLNTYRKKNIDTLLYPFIVFQFLNILYAYIIPIEPLKDNFFYPYHQNWYLIALFWWRTITPYKQFFKDYVVIVSAIVISLGVGYCSDWGNFLGLYKTAYFLPFFILGTYCDNLSELLNKLLRYKYVWISLFIVIMITIMCLSFNDKAVLIMNYGFKANDGYEGVWYGFYARTISMGVSFLSCCSVLVLLYFLYNKLKIKELHGGGTMLCFLGHEFIMIPLIHYFARFSVAVAFFMCFLSSIFVTYILTRKVLVDFFRPLLDLSVLCEKLKIKIYK